MTMPPAGPPAVTQAGATSPMPAATHLARQPRRRIRLRPGSALTSVYATKGLTLPERLFLSIDREAGLVHPTLGSKCHLWVGAATMGGQRSVPYGIINEGSLEGGSWRKCWRVHIVALLLRTAFADVPEVEGELFIPWLYRAKAFYRDQGLEASHQCDVSVCCNPDHLEWETHDDNLYGQKFRAGWRPAGWIMPDGRVMT